MTGKLGYEYIIFKFFLLTVFINPYYFIYYLPMLSSSFRHPQILEVQKFSYLANYASSFS